MSELFTSSFRIFLKLIFIYTIFLYKMHFVEILQTKRFYKLILIDYPKYL
jgi:hypothetical protein